MLSIYSQLTNTELDLIDLLVQTELTPSKNEARRAVDSGAIRINGEKVENSLQVPDQDEFVLQKGKK